MQFLAKLFQQTPSILPSLRSYSSWVLTRFSHVWLFSTLWTVARQAPLSMGFSRQECWSELPCPPPGDLRQSGIEPTSLLSPAQAGGFFTTGATWEAPAPHSLLTSEISHAQQVAFSGGFIHDAWMWAPATSSVSQTVAMHASLPSVSPSPAFRKASSQLPNFQIFQTLTGSRLFVPEHHQAPGQSNQFVPRLAPSFSWTHRSTRAWAPPLNEHLGGEQGASPPSPRVL